MLHIYDHSGLIENRLSWDLNNPAPMFKFEDVHLIIANKESVRVIVDRFSIKDSVTGVTTCTIPVSIDSGAHTWFGDLAKTILAALI